LAASNSGTVVILSFEVIEAFSGPSRPSARSVYGFDKIRLERLIQARESFVGYLANSATGAFGTSILNLMRESVQAALILMKSAPFRSLIRASSPPDGQLTRWRKILSSPFAKNIPLRFLPKSVA
jgi:hypothetical protein